MTRRDDGHNGVAPSEPVVLDPRELDILEGLLRQSLCPQAVALRARVVLAAAEGMGNSAIAQFLGCSRELARRWRDRFAAAQAGWGGDAQEWDRPTLTDKMLDVLDDQPRSGAPATFTAEQLCQIMALACERRRRTAAGR